MLQAQGFGPIAYHSEEPAMVALTGGQTFFTLNRIKTAKRQKTLPKL